ncbi:MAG: HypC/HybG/HupF family hydrogenase formation chaperone [Geminicoccaceae bacterium]|nr:HypC/HybG/HupF family hydrogenase formation chaperone [Geminicoccaceae bacterium]
MCLGIPGRIIEIVDAPAQIALADFDGVRRKVSLACVLDDGADPAGLLGAWVLVHVGFAMSVIDELEAAETLRILASLGELEDEMGAMATSAA